MIIRLPWQGKNVPCAVLDILRGCNAKCSYCFCREEEALHPLEEIANTLRTLKSMRNLQSVMISGGEPTLHPELLDIIRLGVGEGLKVILLTNAILLNDDFAAKLKQAGCSLCFLHIQKGQIRPDIQDPDDDEQIGKLLIEKGGHLAAHGIIAGYCVTLRADQEDDFDAEITRFLSQNIFSHLLLTTAKDPQEFEDGSAMSDVDIASICGRYRRRGFRVFAALGGKIAPKKLRWFAFQAVEARRRDGTVRTRISLRASLGEYLMMHIGRLFKGHYDFFLGDQNSALLRGRLTLNALTGGGIAPLILAFSSLVRSETLHFRNLALETPPYRMPDGRIEHCHDCPGAVYKDGMLKPLCLTDIPMEPTTK